MSQPAPQSETPASDERIRELLQQLSSTDAGTRAEAARQLGASGRRDQQIIWALDRLKSVDRDAEAVAAARAALVIVRPPAPPLTREEKIRHFAIGFVGWFAINGAIWAIWLLITQGELHTSSASPLLILVLFPLNMLTLIVLGFVQRWVALGMLTALALNLLISLILNLFINVVCFVPFFIK